MLQKVERIDVVCGARTISFSLGSAKYMLHGLQAVPRCCTWV